MRQGMRRSHDGTESILGHGERADKEGQESHGVANTDHERRGHRVFVSRVALEE